jgi:hypothetical protein
VTGKSKGVDLKLQILSSTCIVIIVARRRHSAGVGTVDLVLVAQREPLATADDADSRENGHARSSLSFCITIAIVCVIVLKSDASVRLI